MLMVNERMKERKKEAFRHHQEMWLPLPGGFHANVGGRSQWA